LTEYEASYDAIINDYNDMCGYCLRTARDIRYIEDEPYPPMEVEVDETNEDME